MNDVVSMYETEGAVRDLGELGELSSLCMQMLAHQQKVDKMEAELSAMKKVLQEFKVSKIPNLMQELGLNELRLSSGTMILLQRVISCRLKPDLKLEAFTWLEEHEFGSMIKHEVGVELGRGEGALAAKAVELLSGLGLKPSVSKDVHFQTLSAWARRQVEVGFEIPANIFDLSIVNLAKVK